MSKNNEGLDFFGVVTGILAGIIFVMVFCVVVWNVTHKEVKSGLANNEIVKQDEVVVDNTEPSQEVATSTETTTTTETTPEETKEPENNLGMDFDEIDDYVTAKEVTNLRSEPSTSQGAETVVDKLRNGIPAKRTGINEETGWSRLEFNGQVVYAVSQYLLTTDEAGNVTEETNE